MNTWKPVRGFPLYEISSEGEVRKTGFHIRKRNLGNLPLKTGDRGSWYRIDRKQIFLSKLMRENYPYEWIKELEEGEEVKPLKEYPGYFITSYGRVWSMKHYKFLTPNPTKEYYYNTKIYGKNHTIHSLVGRNFLPEYREGLFILHKEETLSYPEINYLSNLWVGNHKENMRDMVKKGRKRKPMEG